MEPKRTDTLSEKEIERRRDETLKRMLKAPPKPHSEVSGKAKKRSKSKTKKG